MGCRPQDDAPLERVAGDAQHAGGGVLAPRGILENTLHAHGGGILDHEPADHGDKRHGHDHLGHPVKARVRQPQVLIAGRFPVGPDQQGNREERDERKYSLVGTLPHGRHQPRPERRAADTQVSAHENQAGQQRLQHLLWNFLTCFRRILLQRRGIRAGFSLRFADVFSHT